MNVLPEHETGLVSSFFVSTRRKRYLYLLENNKRAKFRAYLSHFKDLDLRYATRLEGDQQNIQFTYDKLLDYGATDVCYMISESSEFDGTECNLKSALEAIVGYGISTFISCIPGELVYYESSDINGRFICRKG